jgi:hypothetical protein
MGIKERIGIAVAETCMKVSTSMKGPYSFNKKDNKAAADTAMQNGADPSRCKFYVELLDKAEDGLATLTSMRTQIYGFKSWMTMPYKDNVDLMPIKVIAECGVATVHKVKGKSGGKECDKYELVKPTFEYKEAGESDEDFMKRVGQVTNTFEFFTASMSNLRAEWERALNTFLKKYESVMEIRERDLGGLAKDKYYKTADELRKKYTFDTIFDSPDEKDIEHLQNLLGHDKVTKICEEAAQREADALFKAKNSVLSDVLKPLAFMAEKIKEKEEDEQSRIAIEQPLEGEQLIEYDRICTVKLLEVQQKKPNTKKLSSAQALSIKKNVLGIGKAKPFPSNTVGKVMDGIEKSKLKEGFLTDEERQALANIEATFSGYTSDAIKDDDTVRDLAGADTEDALAMVNKLMNKF